MVFSKEPTCRGKLPSPLLWGISSVSLLLTCTYTRHICNSIVTQRSIPFSVAGVQSSLQRAETQPAWRKLQQHGGLHHGKYCTMCHCTTTCVIASCSITASCTQRANDTQSGPHREALMHRMLTGKANAPEVSPMLTAGRTSELISPAAACNSINSNSRTVAPASQLTALACPHR